MKADFDPIHTLKVQELELSTEAMRFLVEQAMERISAYVESLPVQPAADVENVADLARSVMEPLPNQPSPFPQLLSLLFDKLIPKRFNTAGPGYLAYIPGGGIFHSAVADLIADAVNPYVGVWLAAPALAQLEATVVRWFAEIIGYPREAGGVLTTGGSMANFIAIVAARHALLSENLQAGTIYAGDQVHHSVVKAAILAGFPERNVRVIPSDRHFRIRLDLLQEKIADDRSKGFVPFLAVASAGTTNTGAVDDLSAMADLARRQRLWLHVDAAYGGFFCLTERGRRAMHGMDRADSVVLDPHKGLFLPYGTGSLLVRDGEALRRAHAVHAEYLPPMQDDPDFVDFCLYSPELSRDFRGLRIWLPLKMHGVDPFRRNLEEKLDLAQYAVAQLRTIPGMEIVAEPQLSIVAFRLSDGSMSSDQTDNLNRELLNKINARRRVFLTATTLGNRFVIRICVLSFRTHMDRVQAAIEDIRAAVEELGFAP